MSVHLVGGGWSERYEASVYGPFVAEAAAQASAAGRGVPRIAVIAVRNGDAEEHAATLVAALRGGGDFEAVVTRLREDERLVSAAVETVDGIAVGGGLTPAYLTAVRPAASRIRERVATGVPYLGFSAGSMIAAEHAIIGGWRIDGVEVSPEDGSEDLDGVHIENGLGLVDFAVDVHAAQWGNLSRLLAAVNAGLIDGGVALDENTALIVAGDQRRVVGAGHLWQVTRDSAGLRVSLLQH